MERVVLSPYAHYLRRRLLRNLRSCNDAHTIRKKLVDIHAVGCAPEDIEALRLLDQGLIDKCYELCSQWFGAQDIRCPARVIVVGSEVAFAKLPRQVRYVFQRLCRGCWVFELDAAFVRVSDDHCGSSLYGTIIHELLHALVGVTSRGYPYPCVVEEGMLCLAEVALNLILTDRTWTPWGRDVSIRDLLRIDHGQFLEMSHAERLEFVAIAEKVCEFLAFWFRCKPGAVGLLDQLRRIPVGRDNLAKGIARERAVSPAKLDEFFSCFLEKGCLPVDLL
jgi:hypothetical protein